jgi:DNA (cytosine-5)-methyltransferase 1
MPTYYEFFAGAGMVRAGLGDRWQCLFANDNDPKKAASYGRNWGISEFVERDVEEVTPSDLPGRADLAWASFPCQDLSLAGNGKGLKGERSGTFWPFWRLMRQLGEEGRAPKLVVLENVCGALTSHKGEDFQAIAEALAKEGYRFGALVIDAVQFLPQSRPRLFIVAAKREVSVPARLLGSAKSGAWNTSRLLAAFERLPENLKQMWRWWKSPSPDGGVQPLAGLLQREPEGVEWHSGEETSRLLSLMSPLHEDKVEKARLLGKKIVGTVYRRTRTESDGLRRQRAEVRFDGVAGCLRTPGGGSSRQILLYVDGSNVKSRLLSSREAARLMGLPDHYELPSAYNEAYHLLGDGVAVPVVRHLAATLLEPILLENQVHRSAA